MPIKNNGYQCVGCGLNSLTKICEACNERFKDAIQHPNMSNSADKYQAWFDQKCLEEAEREMTRLLVFSHPLLPNVWEKCMESLEYYDQGLITRERFIEILRGYLLWYDTRMKNDNDLMDKYFWNKPQA